MGLSRALTCVGMSTKLENYLLRSVRTERDGEGDEPRQRYVLEYVCVGCVGLVVSWCFVLLGIQGKGLFNQQ